MRDITVPFGIVLDVTTAMDVVDSWFKRHDPVCKRDGTCPPPPSIVVAAIRVCVAANRQGLLLQDVGVG